MKMGRLGIVATVAAMLALPAAAQTSHVTPATPMSTTVRPAAPASSSIVDINSASAVDLDKLPGIGKSRAEAIVKNRPYKGKDELLSRHIIPSNVYNGIKDKIIARQG